MAQPIQNTYRAYLVRLWRNRDTETWRVTLKNISDEVEHHFPDLESLFVFLAENKLDDRHIDN